MCGITGFFDSSHAVGLDDLQAIVMRMANAIRHRGPDDGGCWVDAEAGIAMGHRRLSIVDLSMEGHQPMPSACGRYVVSFNGEIYNFRSLRLELEGYGFHFRGHSDTEVMLAAIGQWGLEAAVKQFNGMFAFALWDRLERRLHLVRDRMGEKPLYYGWMGKTFLFGSELKAVRVHPDYKGEINRNALALFLRYNYIPAPYSIYEGIYKLPPAAILTIHAENAGSLPAPVCYWSMRDTVEHGTANPFQGAEGEAVLALESRLMEAVKLRMESDVPLGAFLSGGIDSSTIVALMQAQSRRPVKTFTIGFCEEGYNEAAYAKAVAKHLGTEHTEWYVTSEDAMRVIPNLPTLYDEPFSDSSQIPTFIVSQLARQHVTVSLSGDAGDELFGGYNRYFWMQRIWKAMGGFPRGLRGIISSALVAVPPQGWDRIFNLLKPILPSRFALWTFGDKLHKMAEILPLKSQAAIFQSLVSHWKDPAAVVLGVMGEPPMAHTDERQWANLPNFLCQMMYLDAVTYLPDDILVKMDRASMGVGLEARIPFLDHNVFEFAWRLPLSMKMRGREGKWILRQVLYKYVPQDLVERPKTGFGVPIGAWLRGPLREWAEALLDERRLKTEGFFHPQPIRQKWQEHLSGKRNWQYHLWDILMFQAWLGHWK